MTKIHQCQEYVASARMALWEADLALLDNDPRRALTQFDLVQAYLAEARKLLPPTFQPAPKQ